MNFKTEDGKRLPIIAGNWKMNLDHLEAAFVVQKTAWALQDAKHDYKKCEAVVIPPFTSIRTVQTLIESDNLKIGYGAQDVSEHDNGAFTGEVSKDMLAKLNCKYTVVGHSERRQYHGEDDPQVLINKLNKLYEAEIYPIFCVGESLEIREKGEHVKHIRKQLDDVLAKIDKEKVATTVIAYEPIWAIGTGKTASADDAQEVCGEIRKWVKEKFGDELADGIRIQYGGSAKPNNTKEIMSKPDIDGLLVGGASLDPKSFSQMILLATEAKAE